MRKDALRDTIKNAKEVLDVVGYLVSDQPNRHQATKLYRSYQKGSLTLQELDQSIEHLKQFGFDPDSIRLSLLRTGDGFICHWENGQGSLLDDR